MKKFFLLQTLVSLFFCDIYAISYLRYEDAPTIPLWVERHAAFLLEQGVMTGFADNTFRPHDSINRAQAVVLLFRSKKIDYSDTTTSGSPFQDLESNSWYEKPIIKAYKEGWINGRSEKIFAPAEPVNRAEWSAMIIRFFGINADRSFSSKKFSDVSDNAWYTLSARFLREENLFYFPINSDFLAEKPVTRAEAAYSIAQAMNKPGIINADAEDPNEFKHRSIARESRRVSIRPRDFVPDKQGVRKEREGLVVEAHPVEKNVELFIGESEKNIGRVRFYNTSQYDSVLDYVDFSLRFPEGRSGPVQNFSLTLRSRDKRFSDTKDVGGDGNVFFTNLNRRIKSGEFVDFYVDVSALTDRTYLAKPGILFINISQIGGRLQKELVSHTDSESAIIHRSRPLVASPTIYRQNKLQEVSFLAER